MTFKKITAVLAVMAAIALGGFIWSAGAVTYEYDDLNRLTVIFFDDTSCTQFAYDDAGNQLSRKYWSSCPSGPPVSPPPGTTFTITATADPGGTISPSGDASGKVTVNYGGSQSFTIKPNPPRYKIFDVLVDNYSVGAVDVFTFDEVSASHTIHAYFKDPFIITALAGDNGSISPSSIGLDYDGSQTFTITADPGYTVTDVWVDGDDLGPVTSYTFDYVTDDHVIMAAFAATTDVFTVTATAGDGGADCRPSVVQCLSASCRS